MTDSLSKGIDLQLIKMSNINKIIQELKKIIPVPSPVLSPVPSPVPSPASVPIPKPIPSFSPKLEQNINKKRKFSDDKRNEYLEKLTNGKKKAHPWKLGMSKYVTITYVESSKKWILQSSIFEVSETFSKKEDAETFYEKILDKYDISYDYITRNEYTLPPITYPKYKDAIDGLILISK